MWICATNSLGQADPGGAGYLVEPVISIMGQGDYANITAAQAASFADMNLGTFFSNELKVLWKLIVKCNTGYANTPECYIEQMTDLRNTAPIPGTGYVGTDHNSLGGRSEANSHPASAISADTSAFAGNLSVLDDTLQKCMDTIDNLTIGEAAFLYVSTTGDDATGTRGLLTKPYATVVKALTHASSGDVIKLGPGTFTEAGVVIPDAITSISIVGSGRGVTTLTLGSSYIGRVSATAITRFRLAELTYSRGAGTGINFDGSASANGYFNSTSDGLTIENVDDASSGVAAAGWAIERAGYVRFQNVSLLGSGGSLTFTDCGEVRLRNVFKRGVLGVWDILEAVATGTLPTGFTRMLFALYSAKITETTINASSPALDFTTDASCEIDGSVLNFMPDAANVAELSVSLSGRMPDSEINIGADTDTSTTPIVAEIEGVTASPSVSITGSDAITLTASVSNSTIDSISVEAAYADSDVTVTAERSSFSDVTVDNTADGGLTVTFVDSQVPEIPDISGSPTIISRGTTNGTLVPRGWTPLPIVWAYNAGTGFVDTETDPRAYLAVGSPIRFFMPGGEFVGANAADVITATALTGLENVITEPSGRLYFDIYDAGAGNYQVDIYTDVDIATLTLSNLVGHSAQFAAAGTYAVTADNGSAVGGTITVSGTGTVVTSWEFFRWGVVNKVTVSTIEWDGCAIDATAAFMWYGDASRVVQLTAFVGGNIGTDATLIQSTNSQFLIWSDPPARAIRQMFRPSAVTGGGVNATWTVTDRIQGIGAEGNVISDTAVTAAARCGSGLDSRYTTSYNRIWTDDEIDIDTAAIAGGSVDNLSANLICVLE
jgi:hypothetical protein